MEIRTSRRSARGDGPKEPPWLPGAEPGSGRIARTRLRSQDDIRAIEGYRHEELLPARTILGCIASAAEPQPERPAMVFLPTGDPDAATRTVSYAELVASIKRSANLFRAAAEDAPSVVAIILPMLPEGLIALWGGSTAGVSVPINPHLEMKHVVSILNSVRATVLVTTTSRHGSGCWNDLDRIVEAVPSLRRVLIVDADDPADDFAAAVNVCPDELAFVPGDDPHAEAMYLPTGGTTGAPKLARLTHWGQLLVCWNVGALMGPRFDGVVGHGMPNFHAGGTISLGLRTVIYGQTLVTLTPDGFRNQHVVRNFWDIARRFGITSVLSTPTTAAAILAVPGANAEGHKVEDFHCGGSVVPLELVRRFHERFGVWLRENWGLTEVHGTITGHPGGERMPVVGSVGCALPHFQVRAVELDKDNRFLRECAPGERGAIVIDGPSLMPGYSDAGLDGQYFVTNTPGGRPWANSGDVGTVDEQGYVWISGRAKDLIIRGGHNIDPRQIEEVLLEHDAVHIAAAVGRPDPLKGELPMAYVELRQGFEATGAELVELCAARCQERAAIPVEIVILPTMPLTAVGKVSKPALRIDAMKRTVARIASDVLGEEGSFDVAVDETGRRPVAILEVSRRSGDPSAAAAKLRDALAGFEFATEIRMPG